MSDRLRSSLIFGFLSLLASVALIVPLLALAKVDLRPTARLLASTDHAWFAAVVALTGLNTLFSAEKWRAANETTGAIAPSRLTSFALTAIGVGLGQLLPIQVATVLARAIGSRVLGGGTMLRAGATTLYEQAFDIAVFGCFAVASAATLVFRGGVVLWCAFAVVLLGACWMGTGRGVQRLAAALTWMTRRWLKGALSERVGAGLGTLADAEPRHVRRLLLLSICRYATLVALLVAITRAVGLQVSPWQLAAALPFAVIAIAVAATPAGLGVNEWAMSGGLFAFGVSMHTAVQWVVLSRILSTAAAVLVAGVGAMMAAVLWRLRLRRGADTDGPPAADGA